MARKPNYNYEKRQKELARAAKKEEKKRRKQEQVDETAEEGETLAAPDAAEETEDEASL